MTFRLVPRHYYDLHPSRAIATGDIWRGLPTFGVLKSERVSGIVITPSCDLANGKSETVTYLPILRLGHWLQLTAFAGEIMNELRDLLRSLGPEGVEYASLITFPIALEDECEAIHKFAAGKLSGNAKDGEKASRIQLGIEHLGRIKQKTFVECEISRLRQFFGEKNWQAKCEKIIRNSFASDLHFLPADENDAAWSAIPEHSLVLLRYPMTVPYEVLELANDVNIHDWPAALANSSVGEFTAQQFAPERPLKASVLKIEFLSDLLTRYTSLFNRLGSPDFEVAILSQLRDEIR